MVLLFDGQAFECQPLVRVARVVGQLAHEPLGRRKGACGVKVFELNLDDDQPG